VRVSQDLKLDPTSTSISFTAESEVTEVMAIEKFFETLPLHYVQHGISKYGVGSMVLAFFVTTAVGILADYAYMLYLRSKMVSSIV
jgi:hypothetical protein